MSEHTIQRRISKMRAMPKFKLAGMLLLGSAVWTINLIFNVVIHVLDALTNVLRGYVSYMEISTRLLWSGYKILFKRGDE